METMDIIAVAAPVAAGFFVIAGAALVIMAVRGLLRGRNQARAAAEDDDRTA